MKKKAYSVIALVLLFAAFGALWLKFDTDIGLWVQWFQARVEQNYFHAALAFFVLYLVVASFNLPGSGLLTIASGVIFGFVHGLLLVSFASSIGATVAMLMARNLFREWVQRRFASFSQKINKNIEQSGASYLFTLRMLPVVPFFVINPVFGLTSIPVWQFYLVTQLGMIPLTAIYVNLGASVGALENISVWSVFTPELVLAFILLTIFPLVLKHGFRFFRGSI